MSVVQLSRPASYLNIFCKRAAVGEYLAKDSTTATGLKINLEPYLLIIRLTSKDNLFFKVLGSVFPFVATV